MQRDFCKAYVASGCKGTSGAKAAAIAAGYSEATALNKGCHLLKDGRIGAEIELIRSGGGVRDENAPISRDWVLSELKAIAEAENHPSIKAGDRIAALAQIARVLNMAEEAKEELKSRDKGLQITIVNRGGRGDES